MCEDHFSGSSFMNYKKERLVKTAVPTLHMGKNGMAFEYHIDEQEVARLDYEFNDKGKSIDLPDARRVKSLNDATATADEDDECVDSFVDRNSCSPRAAPEASEPILLNAGCQPAAKAQKRFAVKQEKRVVKQEKRATPDDDTEPMQYGKRVRQVSRTKSDGITLASAKTYTKSEFTLPPAFEEVRIDLAPSPNRRPSFADQSDNESSGGAATDNSVYIQMMTEQMRQIEDLKRIIADKMPASARPETSNGHGSQPAGATAAPASAAAAATAVLGVQPIRVEKCPPMTKVQLFNGIRKYLNPSMVALLRMEMFGSSEREYRVDEKQFAKELFGLNENVYDYMRDEWRFRLPPKSEVAKWIKDPDEEETWELC